MEMNIICINEDIYRFKDKYEFIGDVFGFNKKSNPKARFHYITDGKENIRGVTVHDIANYRDIDVKALEANFISLSSIPSELELAWIKRWIVLRNFMSQNCLDKVLYLDNDVLLFTSALEWPQEVRSADYSLSENCSPHTNCINNFSALEAFVDYILDIYVNRNFEFNKLKSIYEEMQAKKASGGVGDMMLWTNFSNQYLFPRAVTDISQIFDKNQSFDHNIHTTNDIWVKSGKYKKIIFKDGCPYGKQLNGGSLIKFNTLHFQGGAKRKMFHYLQTQS